MKRKNDGKIRTRCQTCGKRVKFPANMAGEPFRCPVCHTTMVAPLDGNDIQMPRRAELLSAAARLRPEHRPSTPSALSGAEGQVSAKPQAGVAASKRSKRKHHESRTQHPVERFGHILNDETIGLARTSCTILADPEASAENKARRLNGLLKIRTARLREEATTIMADLDHRIQSLKHSPASDTLSNRRNITVLEAHLREMRMYLDVMFGLSFGKQIPTGGSPVTPRRTVASESPVAPCDSPNPA